MYEEVVFQLFVVDEIDYLSVDYESNGVIWELLVFEDEDDEVDMSLVSFLFD